MSEFEYLEDCTITHDAELERFTIKIDAEDLAALNDSLTERICNLALLNIGKEKRSGFNETKWLLEMRRKIMSALLWHEV